jgi:hypothetical protein
VCDCPNGLGGLREVHSYNEKMKEQYENEKREKELFEDDRSYTIDYIDKLDGYEFEDYLATLFEKFGYEIQRM